MAEFLMPSLGADMEAGKLVEWLVKPGAEVKKGDVIAVVETQKGAIEIENFEDGFFERVLVDIGATVPVGSPIALIRRDGETPDSTTKVADAPTKGEFSQEPKFMVPPEPSAVAVPVMPAPQQSGERVKVTPAARRYAAEHGIDLSTQVGHGPSGEVRLSDLGAVAEIVGEPATEKPDKPELGHGEKLSGMRAAIAAAMSRSKREIPHYYLAHTIDLTAAEKWLSNANAGQKPEDRLLLGALLVKAVALAAKKYPEFNGHFTDGVFQPSPAVHTGVAINIRGTGLVAPAIHDVERLTVSELMAAMRDLVARVRAGRFRSSELSDPTLTISSLGDRGVETLYGVIYPPQVAIVGFGTPQKEVCAVDGLIGERLVVHATLAGDHRVSDGHRGALFLSRIENLLQEPEKL